MLYHENDGYYHGTHNSAKTFWSDSALFSWASQRAADSNIQPVTRDTILIPSNTLTIIAFEATNPGA